MSGHYWIRVPGYDLYYRKRCTAQRYACKCGSWQENVMLDGKPTLTSRPPKQKMPRLEWQRGTFCDPPTIVTPVSSTVAVVEDDDTMPPLMLVGDVRRALAGLPDNAEVHFCVYYASDLKAVTGDTYDPGLGEVEKQGANLLFKLTMGVDMQHA